MRLRRGFLRKTGSEARAYPPGANASPLVHADACTPIASARNLNSLLDGFLPAPRATATGELRLVAARRTIFCARPHASRPTPRQTPRNSQPAWHRPQRRRRGIVVDYPTKLKSLAP